MAVYVVLVKLIGSQYSISRGIQGHNDEAFWHSGRYGHLSDQCEHLYLSINSLEGCLFRSPQRGLELSLQAHLA